MLTKRFFTLWVLFCWFLSIYSYVGDCIINPEYGFKNINFLPAYLLLHLVYQAYLIGPAVLFYSYLSRNKKEPFIFNLIFLVFIALLVEFYLRVDSWNLTVGKHGDLKQILAYIFAALSIAFIDKYYFKSNHTPK